MKLEFWFCSLFCDCFSISKEFELNCFLARQLDGSIVQIAQMDGFLQHLQNEQKEAIIKEEPDLHVYSSKDVDMYGIFSMFTYFSAFLISKNRFQTS